MEAIGPPDEPLFKSVKASYMSTSILEFARLNAKLLPESPAPRIAIFLMSLDFLFSINFLPIIRCLLVPNPDTLLTSKPFSKSALLILPTEVKELKVESQELRSKTVFKISSSHISGFFFGSNPSKNHASMFDTQISFIAFCISSVIKINLILRSGIEMHSKPLWPTISHSLRTLISFFKFGNASSSIIRLLFSSIFLSIPM